LINGAWGQSLVELVDLIGKDRVYVSIYGAEYKAVCGMDFVNSWTYYDTFATRDSEGYSLGVPIFPWFANEGDATSRNDVLEGRDAVRVKSCWGGIVAFDARYLQRDLSSFHINATEHFKISGKSDANALDLPQLPLRFRSEPEPFWDSSECCLIHADIIALPPFLGPSKELKKEYGDGIFMNPYVRVSYDMSTQKHIWLAQRFERLLAVPQAVINRFAHMPRSNYRREEVKGELVEDRVWV
ncbi:glycosyltransferase family 69 protein, partial [Cadophora sp. DSE1049]